MKIAVIADDFTGANDAGIRFKEFGLNVISSFGEEKYNSDVVIIDTESRNIDSKAAYNIIKEKFIQLKKEGFNKFYKKIDSTLRGNVAVELEAVAGEIGDNEKLIVIPSFPDTGRIVIDGKIYIGEIPLHKTEFAKDPIHPIRNNDIRTLTGGDIITIKEVRYNLVSALTKNRDNKIVAIDCETNKDLETIAKTLFETGYDRYIAGSAAILKYMPSLWGMKKERVIIVSGSCNDKNLEQLSLFINNNKNVEVLKIDIFGNNDSLIEYASKLNKDIVITSILNKPEMEEAFNKFFAKGIDNKISADIISDNLAKCAAKIIKNGDIRKIIVSGGETSMKLMKNIGMTELNIQKEVDTGIPLSYTMDLKYAIITKPGGFGNKNIFFRGYEILKYAENTYR